MRIIIHNSIAMRGNFNIQEMKTKTKKMKRRTRVFKEG